MVNVPSGNTYTTSGHYNLPPTNCDASHWVIIQSDHLALLPAQGNRISASTANMPTLSTSNFADSVIVAADNPATPLNAVGSACTATGGGASTVPCGYWLAGLDIEDDPPNTGTNQLALLQIGDYCNIGGGGCPITSGMSAKNLASRFTIDRCWIHPTQATSNILHGIRFTASYLAVEDSIVEAHYTQIGGTGQTTGISSDFTIGPVDIGNSEIMAVTENMIFGGNDPAITNSVPSDIYIHQNYIHKRPEWFDGVNTGYFETKMRNWIECKNCQRMLVEGNVFDRDDGNSVSAAFQFTPRNVFGTCTWCVIQDVTIRYNKVSNLSDLVEIIGANGASSGGSTGPELPSKRISLHDNIVENVNDITFGGNGRIAELLTGDATASGCSGTPNSSLCQMSDIIITHNTIAGADGVGGGVRNLATLGSNGGASPPASSDKGFNLVYTNNIVPAGAFLLSNDAGTSSNPISGPFATYWSSFAFDRNVITGIAAACCTTSQFTSPTCNYSGTSGCTGTDALGWAATMSNVGFVNYNSGSGGDYHLSTSSIYHNQALDGTDVGANVDTVNSYTSGVLQGTPTLAITLPNSQLAPQPPH